MALARIRGSAPTLATIALVVALVSAISIATVVFLDERATSGLTSELSQRSGSHLALRATFDRATEAEVQDVAVRAAIDRTFVDTGVSFTVIRALEADAYVTFVAEDGTKRSSPSTASTFSDLAEHAVFEAGSAAVGDREVAVQVDAAHLIGAKVGDELLINDVPFTISGTWRAKDPLDPRWHADSRVVTGGVDDDRLGPFALDEPAWSRVPSFPIASWTIVPVSLADITATNFSAIVSAWAEAQSAWRGSVPEYESMEVQSGLSRTLDEFAQRITGLRAIEPAAFVLMVGSALVGLSQLVQLLVASRERESALFWARGQSPAGLARRLTAEVTISAIIGAGLGVAIVAGGTIVLDQGIGLRGVRPIALIIPALIVGGAAVLAAIAAGRTAVAISTPRRGGRGTARVARVAVPGVVALVTISAVIAIWQLQLYGSPLIATAAETVTINPVAVAAPTATLVAVVLLGLASFPRIVASSARVAGRAGMRAYLAARTLTRDPRRVVAPLVVVALAVGSLGVAASFSATWAPSFSQSAQLYAGADLRVSSRFVVISPTHLDAVALTDGVDDVAPLELQTLSLGPAQGVTLAAAPGAVRDVVTTADGTFDRERAAEAIRMTPSGPEIRHGTSEITLRVEALGFAEPPTVTAWVADSVGRLHSLVFREPEILTGGVLAYRATPAELEGTILSFDIGLPERAFEAPPTFRLLTVASTIDQRGRAVVLDQFWLLDSLLAQRDAPQSWFDGRGFVLTDALPMVRMTASLDGTVFDQVRPRVLISAALASRLGLDVGDDVAFGINQTEERVNGTVEGIVPAIPGARADIALLMDIAISNHFRLRSEPVPGVASDLWIAADRPEEVRDAVRSLLPADTRFDTSRDEIGDRVLGAAAVAVWAAALSCLLIAIAAVAAASRSRVHRGRSEFGTLRAVGLGPRDQASIVLREFAVVLTVASVTGLMAGTAVAALTVPQLARAAVDRAFLAGDTLIAVDWSALGLGLGVLTVGIGAVLIDLNRRVTALARTSMPGNEHS